MIPIPSYKNRPPEDGNLSEAEYLSLIEGGYKPRMIFSQRSSSMTDQEMRDYSIERLVLAERERCARIADGKREPATDQWDAGYEHACIDIAAAIRSGK